MRRTLALLATASLLIGAAQGPLPPSADGVYQPQDRDERGLWMLMDEQERALKTSSFVVEDPALNAYVRSVMCHTVGDSGCRDLRLYIVRNPGFNAVMAANGMVQVWTGLLLRCHNEAQLAAILGHEYIHYRERHSLNEFRNIRSTTGAASVLMLGGLAGSLVALLALTSSFEHSREHEREADLGGADLMAAAGYDPRAAAEIWEQQRQEVEATADARNTAPRYHNGGIFATHPNSLDRMNAMRAKAATLNVSNPVTREDAYRQALGPWRQRLMDDELKLNDFGGAEFLLASLAAKGWTPELLCARGDLYRSRGRPEDLSEAEGFYRQATTGAEAPAEAWRGLGLALLRLGRKADGQGALNTYLTMKPDAPDRAMMQMLAGVAT